jgi:hypothetical protein
MVEETGGVDGTARATVDATGEEAPIAEAAGTTGAIGMTGTALMAEDVVVTGHATEDATEDVGALLPEDVTALREGTTDETGRREDGRGRPNAATDSMIEETIEVPRIPKN